MSTFFGKTFINHLVLKQKAHRPRLPKMHINFVSDLSVSASREKRWIWWFISIFMAIALHYETQHNGHKFPHFLIQKGYMLMVEWDRWRYDTRNGVCMLFIRSFHSCCARCVAYINVNDNLCIVSRMISLLNRVKRSSGGTSDDNNKKVNS